MSLNDSTVEVAPLIWFEELGYAIGQGPHLAPGEPAAERDSFGEVVLVRRFRDAIRRLKLTPQVLNKNEPNTSKRAEHVGLDS